MLGVEVTEGLLFCALELLVVNLTGCWSFYWHANQLVKLHRCNSHECSLPKPGRFLLLLFLVHVCHLFEVVFFELLEGFAGPTVILTS